MDCWESYEASASAIEEGRFEIVDFMRFNEKSDIWNFIPHSHGFYELLFFLHGNAQISLGQQSLYATFSDVLLYPPRAEHTEHLQISHKQEIYCLQVRFDGPLVPRVLHQQDRRQQIRMLLDGLFGEYHSDRRDPGIEADYLKLIARTMARAHFLGDAPAHPIEVCMMYMRHNFSRYITIQQLADLIHVSRSHLNKLFTQRIGMTPMQYLTDIRLDAAKSLLTTSRQSISDIAAQVGFNSPKYFCYAFHRGTGLSPRDFRTAEGLETFTKASGMKPAID